MSIARAEIINKNDESQKAVCMFNPNEYVFTKQNNWSERPVKGKNSARLEFGGGNPATITLKLFFDTYEDHPPVGKAGADVRAHTRPLWDMMQVSAKDKNPTTGRGEPPHVIFRWGNLWSFEAVITSLSQRFTLFLGDGTPVRATIDITLRQVRDEGQYPRQNPTSGGGPGEQIHIVQASETLAGIAYAVYGDPAAWRRLALRNTILDPFNLRPGDTLVVPALTTEP